jgi:hypothetical protein
MIKLPHAINPHDFAKHIDAEEGCWWVINHEDEYDFYYEDMSDEEMNKLKNEYEDNR